MGKLSRRKGASWEREVARDLRPIFGEGVKRGLAQSRFGTDEAPDVDGASPFWYECKHGKSILFQAALEQAEGGMAEAGRPQDRWPVAVCKVDHKEPLVLMRWVHFLELVAEWRTNGGSDGGRHVDDQDGSFQGDAGGHADP